MSFTVYVKTWLLVKNGILNEQANKTSKNSEQDIDHNNTKKVTDTKILPENEREKFDPFLEISCEYLHPNLIDDDFLKSDGSHLAVFQNNIRSLNKHFHLVEEIFHDCAFPDILAFSETKLVINRRCPRTCLVIILSV